MSGGTSNSGRNNLALDRGVWENHDTHQWQNRVFEHGPGMKTLFTSKQPDLHHPDPVKISQVSVVVFFAL